MITAGAGTHSLQLAGHVLSLNSWILLLKRGGEILVDKKQALSSRPPETWVFSVVNKYIDLLICTRLSVKSQG